MSDALEKLIERLREIGDGKTGLPAEAADAIKALIAERDKLKEELHYANGTCDLAMKHRNIAEADRDKLKTDVERPAGQRVRNLHPIVVYRDEDGRLWVRSEEAFTSDRIELLIAAAPAMLAELERLYELYGHQQTAGILARAKGPAS